MWLYLFSFVAAEAGMAKGQGLRAVGSSFTHLLVSAQRFHVLRQGYLRMPASRDPYRPAFPLCVGPHDSLAHDLGLWTLQIAGQFPRVNLTGHG